MGAEGKTRAPGPDKKQLVETSMALRAAAPREWAQFLAAFRDFDAQILMQMRGCHPEMLQRAQGMSIMSAELAQTLTDAPRILEHIQQAMRNTHGRKL